MSIGIVERNEIAPEKVITEGKLGESACSKHFSAITPSRRGLRFPYYEPNLSHNFSCVSPLLTRLTL